MDEESLRNNREFWEREKDHFEVEMKKIENELIGEMIYCSCGTFIGRTTPPPDYGKTVTVIDNSCKSCHQHVNLLKRSEHE